MKNIYKKLTLLLLAVGSLSSCERDDPEIEMTAVGYMAGEWWVTYQIEVAPGQYEDIGGGYYHHQTYNTSENVGDSMFVDDLDDAFGYKVKVSIDNSALTFAGADDRNFYFDPEDEDEGSPPSVTINNGKVIRNGGESRTGVQVDSIYYELSLSNDPDNTIFVVSGHRRTGFAEDEF